MTRGKTRFKKEDKVKVITGKDQGKIGKILKVYRKKDRVLVEKVNMMKRHTRPGPKSRQGGIVESEAPIQWSNVMLLCSKCMKPARIKMKELEDGKKVRACSRCSEIIDS